MNNFGTQNIAVGTPAQFNTGMNWEYLQISNESGYQLDLNFSGIGSRGFNPWQRDDIAITKGYTGQLVITASNPGGVDITKFPTSYVQVNAYIPGELVQPMSVALTRLSNIGNPVDSTVTATNSISNTGNAPLSNWLAVQPNDALSNTFTGDTSGNLSISSDNVGVLTTLLQLIAGASPAVKIAAAAIVAEVLGDLQVDGTIQAASGANLVYNVPSTFSHQFNVAGTKQVQIDANGVNITSGKVYNTNGQVILDASGGDTALNALGSTNAIHLASPSGTDVAKFAYNQINFYQGLAMQNGHIIAFNIGQIKDLNNGTALSGTINHGLTGSPAAVLATCDSTSSSATTGAYSYTSTQFGLTVGGSLNARWVAYR